MHSSTPQPKRLGKYEVSGTIAVGSRWRIYKGFDPASQLKIALKAIPKDILERSGNFPQLRSDIRAAGVLEHPGIVRVYGYGEEGGLFYVVMEEADGWHLKERFRVPLPDAVNLSEQLLDALDYAHGLGVVHGGIKPSNLLLTGNGQLRVINFGLTKSGDESPNYKSPEQLKKSPFDRRSDIFSAGMVFYELLTGAYPFAGPAQEIPNRICDGKEKTPSQVNSAVLPAFDEVSAKALAKIPDARYSTARAFGDGIRKAFASAHDSHLSRRVSNETIIAFTSPRREAEHEPAVAPPFKTPSQPSVTPVQPQPQVHPEPPAQPAPPVRPSTPLSTPLQASAPPASVQRTSIPEFKPEAKPVPKPEPKPEIKQTPAAAQVTPEMAARLEHLLGKQTPTLAGYLQDNPPELDRVVSPFVSTVRALIAINEAKGKSDALIPQNIHFDQLGKATVQAAPSSSAEVTTVMSNPRYAAPEMFSEKAAAADSSNNTANVYALGMMFYEILLGRKLFERTFPDQRNDIDWMRWHADLESKAPALKSLLPECPAAMSDVVESMMEKHVEKRSTDLNEILGRLRSVAQRANKTVVLQRPAAEASPAPEPASASPLKRKTNWLNPILFLLIVGGLGWVGYRVWQDPDFLNQVVRQVTAFFSGLAQKF
jgi:serine/threonine protein kinase